MIFKREQISAKRLFCEQILVFPLAVKLLCSISLIFGASIAAWQWWATLAVTLAASFARAASWKKAAAASVGFAAFVFAVWLYTGMTITKSGIDQLSCHFPAIRLLMLGWNPVWQPTIEEICQFGAIEPSSFHVWHILCMPRSVWYFSACAAFFAQNPFNLFYPILIFMLAGTSIAVCRCMREVGFPLRAVAVLALVWMIRLHEQAADAVMALAFTGLVACQFAALRKKDAIEPLPLVVFTFWLFASKPLGAVFCAIAWGAFIVAGLLRWRKDFRVSNLARLGAVAAALILCAHVSPYISNTFAYSHPFYPKWTFDAKNHPAKNLTSDFLNTRNDDAKEMSGRLPMFLNAYVSPALVHKYYSRKLDKPDFNPRCKPWDKSGYPDGSITPLNTSFRLWFMIPMVLLLRFGKTPERFAAAAMLLSTFLVPAEMIGYERYVRFIQVAYIFTFPMLYRFCSKIPVANIFLSAVATLYGLYLAANAAQVELESIDRRLATHDILVSGLPETIYPNQLRKREYFKASLDLMRRLVPRLGATNSEDLPDVAFVGEKANGNQWIESPDGSFRTAKKFDSSAFLPSRKICAEAAKRRPEGAFGGALYDFEMFWRCIAKEFPRAILLRLNGDMAASLRAGSPRTVRAKEEFYTAPSEKFLSSWRIELYYTSAAPSGASIEGCDANNWKYPEALKRNDHTGCLLIDASTHATAEVICSHDGDVVLALRVPRFAKEGAVLPFWCDYASFSVNGEEKLEGVTAVSFAKYRKIPLKVKAGERLTLEFATAPHRYKREELRALLLDMSAKTLATPKTIDGILSSPRMAPYLE